MPKSAPFLLFSNTFRTATYFLLLASSLVLLGSTEAHAANGTWTSPNGGLYYTTTNWSGNTVASGGVATFSNSGPGTVTINGGLALTGVTFNSNASAYTIAANSGFYLQSDNAGMVIQTTGTGANSQNFSSAVYLRGGATGVTFTSDYTTSSKALNFSGNVLGNANGTNVLTLNGANTGANTVSGIISNTTGTTALVKSGTGNWIASGNNTYTGTTSVNGGQLLVTGTTTGGGLYTVSGGRLGGAGGTIGAAGVTVTATAGSGINVSGAGLGSVGSQNGLVAPGTLSLNLGANSLNISNAGATSLTFVLKAPGTSDQVRITSGTLNIGSGVLNLSKFNFDISNWTDSSSGTYILFATPSSLGITGTLASTGLTGTLGGHAVTLSKATDGSGFADIQLTVAAVVVPEPSTTALVAVGIAGCLVAAYRRQTRLS